MSERYPCLSRVVRENEVPAFDNLYLDMNGIIHNCSHPDGADPNLPLDEDMMFKDIVKYIEMLFSIIKPQRLFYMAIDGCAPRAKMNQQRARRFRSAHEAAQAAAKAAKEKGSAPFVAFDSNCITPGTPFMARLQARHYVVSIFAVTGECDMCEQTRLEYFVQDKLNSDPLWRAVSVIFSGHQVPGEGEHKIMDYIRAEKLRAGYDPNTRHCLYGLDADLMVLGLLSHEPHFTLLREEVRFGNRKAPPATRQTFHLLSLKLFREYLDLEFRQLQPVLSFPYDLERLIDDWVLLGFFVGNDFLPHLPNFHIGEDILPMIYETYKKALPRMGGWLNAAGELQMDKMDIFLRLLATLDRGVFRSQCYSDFSGLDDEALPPSKRPLAKKLRSSTSAQMSTKNLLLAGIKKEATLENIAVGDFEDIDTDDSHGSEGSDGDDTTAEGKDSLFEGAVVGSKIICHNAVLASAAEFEVYKRDYYQSKLHVDTVDRAFLHTQATEYMTGLQWVLLYYYRGVPDWGWFFPQHYAPYVSDLTGIADFRPHFAGGKPFLPFQQLLSVLPLASKALVPVAYQALMEAENSPILDFYPAHFETDLNGKKADWEALVLIPFINSERLLDAMAPFDALLTAEEQSRNCHTHAVRFVRDGQAAHTVAAVAVAGGMLPAIAAAAVRAETLPHPHAPPGAAIYGLCAGVDMTSYLPGFPSFQHAPFDTVIRSVPVTVFTQPSRNASVVLTLHAAASREIPALGTDVWVGWPHMREACVVGVASERESFLLTTENTVTRAIQADRLGWCQRRDEIVKLALTTRAIVLGSVEWLVQVKECVGLTTAMQPDGTFAAVNLYADVKTWHPLQLTLWGLPVRRGGAAVAPLRSLAEYFRIGAPVVVVEQPQYGSLGCIAGVDVARKTIDVTLQAAVTPDIRSFVRLMVSRQPNQKWLVLHQVAGKVGVSPLLLGRLLSSLFVDSLSPGSGKIKLYNLGFNIKNGKKKQEALDLVKCDDTSTFVNENAVVLLRNFKAQFSTLVAALEATKSMSRLSERDLVAVGSEGAAQLASAAAWIHQHVTPVSVMVPFGTQALPATIIAALDAFVQQGKLAPCRPMHVPRLPPSHVRLLGDGDSALVELDAKAVHELGDRVRCVATSDSLPAVGALGVVVTVFGDDIGDMEVLFDDEFSAGTSLSGKCPENRGILVSRANLVNISHGLRAGGVTGVPLAAWAKAGHTVAVAAAGVADAAAHPVQPPQGLADVRQLQTLLEKLTMQPSSPHSGQSATFSPAVVAAGAAAALRASSHVAKTAQPSSSPATVPTALAAPGETKATRAVPRGPGSSKLPTIVPASVPAATSQAQNGAPPPFLLAPQPAPPRHQQVPLGPGAQGSLSERPLPVPAPVAALVPAKDVDEYATLWLLLARHPKAAGVSVAPSAATGSPAQQQSQPLPEPQPLQPFRHNAGQRLVPHAEHQATSPAAGPPLPAEYAMFQAQYMAQQQQKQQQQPKLQVGVVSLDAQTPSRTRGKKKVKAAGNQP